MGDKGLSLLLVSFLEFVDPARSIHQDILSGVKGMRGVRNLQLDDRIFVTVFPLHGFFAIGGGAAEELVPVTHVLEHNETVILGMQIFFHNLWFTWILPCFLFGVRR